MRAASSLLSQQPQSWLVWNRHPSMTRTTTPRCRTCAHPSLAAWPPLHQRASGRRSSTVWTAGVAVTRKGRARGLRERRCGREMPEGSTARRWLEETGHRRSSCVLSVRHRVPPWARRTRCFRGKMAPQGGVPRGAWLHPACAACCATGDSGVGVTVHGRQKRAGGGRDRPRELRYTRLGTRICPGSWWSTFARSLGAPR